MKNLTKQAIILENFSSPYIHQAILILKDYNPALENKVIEDAERVVSEYLKQPCIAVRQKTGRLSLGMFWFGILATIAAVFSYIK